MDSTYLLQVVRNPQARKCLQNILKANTDFQMSSRKECVCIYIYAHISLEVFSVSLKRDHAEPPHGHYEFTSGPILGADPLKAIG